MKLTALIMDNDIHFILRLQKTLPRETEWYATMEPARAKSLLTRFTFDLIFIRKKNMAFLDGLLQEAGETAPYRPFKELIILPRMFWKRCIAQRLRSKNEKPER